MAFTEKENDPAKMLASQQVIMQAFLTHEGSLTTIAPFIEGPADEIQQRLAIYYDAYRGRMVDILRVAYPKLAVCLGDDAFADLVVAYSAKHPSSHPSARYIGQLLPDFLHQHEQPILAELAQFEWALGDALDAANTPLLTLTELLSLNDPDWPALQLALHASVQVLELHSNAPMLWQQLGQQLADNKPTTPHYEQTITHWIIWRYQQTAYFTSLDVPSARLFHLLQQKLSFADICAALCDEMPEEGVSPFIVHFLQHWVAQDCICYLAQKGYD